MTILQQLAEIVARLQCICDGLGQSGSGGPEIIYEPVPGDQPALPPIDESDLAVIGPGNQCQSAHAAVVYARDILSRFGELLDVGGLNLQEVYIVLAGSLGGIGAIALVVGGSVGAVFAAVLAIFAFAGYGAGLFLREQAAMIPDDAFVCAFTQNTSPADVRAGIADALAENNINTLVRWVLNESFTVELIAQIQKHTAFDEATSEPVALDFSAYPSSCACESVYDEVWLDFVGYEPDIIDDCEDERYDMYNEADELSTTRRFFQAVPCDGGNLPPSSVDGASCLVIPWPESAKISKSFEVPVAGDYHIEWLLAAPTFGGQDVFVETVLLPGNSLSTQAIAVSSGSRADAVTIMENLSPGNYEVKIWRSSSGAGAYLLRAVLKTGLPG